MNLETKCKEKHYGESDISFPHSFNRHFLVNAPYRCYFCLLTLLQLFTNNLIWYVCMYAVWWVLKALTGTSLIKQMYIGTRFSINPRAAVGHVDIVPLIPRQASKLIWYFSAIIYVLNAAISEMLPLSSCPLIQHYLESQCSNKQHRILFQQFPRSILFHFLITTMGH